MKKLLKAWIEDYQQRKILLNMKLFQVKEKSLYDYIKNKEYKVALLMPAMVGLINLKKGADFTISK